MKMRKCSAAELNRKLKKSKLIVFGAGNNMYAMFKRFKKFSYEKNVGYLIDNNKKRVGEKVFINGTELEIESPTILEQLDLKKYIVVITPNQYKEIFCQIQNLDKNVRCYFVPQTLYSFEELAIKFFMNLPLKSSILLGGQNDTCENAIAFGKYIAENAYFNKYRLIWLCDEPQKNKANRNEKYIKRGLLNEYSTRWERILYYSRVYTARYIVYENKEIKKVREDQISIYLCHGGPIIKNVKGLINLPDDLNYAVFPSEFAATQLCEQYRINRERVFIGGAPRLDVLYTNYVNQEIISFLNQELYSKTILWVPTFREQISGRCDLEEGFAYGIPIIETQEQWKDLLIFLKRENIQIIFKPHRYQDLSFLKVKDIANFRIITQDELDANHINICEMLNYVDAMITDYSSIAFDFMIVDRMIGYTLDDMERYKRGFAIENIFEIMPGEKIYNIDDFITFLSNVIKNNDTYKEQRREVNKLAHAYLDGKNSERLCAKLHLAERRINENFHILGAKR